MSDWIKVSDEKPPVFEWFIGYGDDIEFIFIDTNGDFFVWEGSRVPYFGSEITHWQPMLEVQMTSKLLAEKMRNEIDKIKAERIKNGTETKTRTKRSRKVAKQS